MAGINVQVRPGHVRVDRAAVAEFMRTDPGIQRDMARRGDRMMAGWRRAVPAGRLQQTFRMQPGTRSGAGVTCIAGAEGVTPYLGYVLYGTAPHVITPARRKVLRFVSRGAVVFAGQVNHPGTRANDFLTNCLPLAGD